MDPVTQAVVGGLAAQAVARSRCTSIPRRQLVIASVCGMIGGLAPDLDILIRSTEDPLVFWHYHRHFTHALSFILVGGVLSGLFAWSLFRNQETLRHLLLWTTVGYATHGLIDALTSYGTWLLWPFSDMRVSWDVIAVIDPLFTLPLLILFVWSLFRPSGRVLLIAFAWMGLYLSASLFQHQRAVMTLAVYADNMAMKTERYRVMPSLFNNLLWRAIWEVDDQVHVAEIKVPWWSKSCTSYSGSLPLVFEGNLKTSDWNSIQWDDFMRFRHFTDGWMVELPGAPGTWSDARYAPAPGALRSLWGIIPGDGSRHARFLRSPRDFAVAMQQHANSIIEVVTRGCSRYTN